MTPEMAAQLAVENRLWALHHPHAAMRHKGPITVQDVLASRLIASPLRGVTDFPHCDGKYGRSWPVDSSIDLLPSNH